MNTFQLECFLTVADTLNFAKAAQILNITQPAVTKNIKSLEDELNVRLFMRSTRNVELTSEGKLLVNDAQNIIKITRRAKNRFIEPEEEFNTLTIGLRLPSHIKLLKEPLKELMKRHGNFRPQIRTMPFPQLLRQLKDEQLDIIFDVKNLDEKSEGVIFKELFREKTYCVCTDKYPLFNRENVTAEEIRNLTDIPLIFLEAPKVFRKIHDIQNNIIGERNQSNIHICSTVEEMTLLAELEYGMMIIPEKNLPQNPDLHKIPIIGCEDISFGMYVKSSNFSGLAKELIELMKNEDYGNADGSGGNDYFT